MALFEKELTVLGITPQVEIVSGEPTYLVSMGEIVDKTPQISSRLPAAQQAGGSRVAINMMAFWMKYDKEIPYKVGTKWKLSISDTGSLTLVELK